MKPSLPLATTCGLVESGKGAAQLPDPPNPKTLADEHETVTAETGTAEQLAKLDAAAWTLNVQFVPLPQAVHCAVVVAFPATAGLVAGFVPVKEMVAGVTFNVKLFCALGVTTVGFGLRTTWTGGRSAAAIRNAMETQDAISQFVPSESR